MLERSGPHRAVEAQLDRMGLEYESEVRLDIYQLDIYLGEFHVCIEVDGIGHYPRRDNRRDSYLMRQYNLPTLRIRGAANDGIIRSFIERWAASASERRA